MEGSGPVVGPIGGRTGGGRRGGGGMADEGAGDGGGGVGGGGGAGGGGRSGGGADEIAGGGSRGSVQGPEVVICWQTAKPIAEVTKVTLPASLDNHYAIGVTGLPPAMLIAPGRGRGRGRGRDGSAVVPETPEDPAAQQKAMIDRLKSSARMEAKGKDPATADLLLQTANKQTVIFGFPKEGFPLAVGDKEVVFTLKLMATFKAKFELKDMMYGGQLAV